MMLFRYKLIDFVTKNLMEICVVVIITAEVIKMKVKTILKKYLIHYGRQNAKRPSVRGCYEPSVPDCLIQKNNVGNKKKDKQALFIYRRNNNLYD